MLWCPAGTCICTGNYQWNTTAQNCSCGLYQIWTGFKCQSYGSYGDPCNIIPCKPTLTCNAVVSQTYTTGQSICSCDNTTYLNVIGGATYGQCIPRITYNASCQTTTDCQSWLGLACTSTTSGKIHFFGRMSSRILYIRDEMSMWFDILLEWNNLCEQ